MKIILLTLMDEFVTILSMIFILLPAMNGLRSIFFEFLVNIEMRCFLEYFLREKELTYLKIFDHMLIIFLTVKKISTYLHK